MRHLDLTPGAVLADAVDALRTLLRSNTIKVIAVAIAARLFAHFGPEDVAAIVQNAIGAIDFALLALAAYFRARVRPDNTMRGRFFQRVQRRPARAP